MLFSAAGEENEPTGAGRIHCRLRSRNEQVTFVTYCTDILLFRADVTQLFPDLANAGLKVMAAFIDGLLPYIIIKLLIGKKLVRMACKKGENIEFQTGKGIFHSMINDHEPAGINS